MLASARASSELQLSEFVRWHDALRRTFTLVLIKPPHDGDDGIVIQWMRSAIPSNTLAVLNGLGLDGAERQGLGSDVDIVIEAIDETKTRVRTDRIARSIRSRGGHGLAAPGGVQSNQFPRAVDFPADPSTLKT